MCDFDERRASVLKAMLVSAVQRRFPQGVGLLIQLQGCLICCLRYWTATFSHQTLGCRCAGSVTNLQEFLWAHWSYVGSSSEASVSGCWQPVSSLSHMLIHIMSLELMVAVADHTVVLHHIMLMLQAYESTCSLAAQCAYKICSIR